MIRLCRFVDGASRHLAALLVGASLVLAQSPRLAATGCQYRQETEGVLLECAQATGNATLQGLQTAMQSGSGMSLSLRDQAYNDTAFAALFTESVGKLMINLEMANITVDFESTVVLNAFNYLVELQTLQMDNMTVPRVTRRLLVGKTKLVALDLNDDGTAGVEENAFDDLQNLELLSLRNNKLTEFPVAIKATPKLQTLDLSGNDITTVGDATAAEVRDRLPRLGVLYLNRLHCTCPFGKGKFVQWVQKQGIEEVMCAAPEKLAYRYVKDIDVSGFCAGNMLTALSVLVAAAAALALLR